MKTVLSYVLCALGVLFLATSCALVSQVPPVQDPELPTVPPVIIETTDSVTATYKIDRKPTMSLLHWAGTIFNDREIASSRVYIYVLDANGKTLAANDEACRVPMKTTQLVSGMFDIPTSIVDDIVKVTLNLTIEPPTE